MKKIAILYGSSLGNTRFIAEKIKKLIPHADIASVSGLTTDDVEYYSTIILGVSTWGVGGLQDEFETFVDTLLQANLKGKNIALFGCGDQQTYPDTFCNAIGRLYELLEKKECTIIGEWPIEGYDFSQSLALRNGKFVGLALDEENQPDLSDYRINKWVQLLKERVDL